MINTRLHFTICVIATLTACSCSQVDSIDRSVLERLSSANRDEWLDAARRLGAIADGNGRMRLEVWRCARINSLGMRFVLAPAGQFIMGSNEWRRRNHAPAHPVEITRPFYIAVTEVTNEQFKALFPEYVIDNIVSAHTDSPAVNITWEQAVEFCARLSRREGARYRLPTEAEWEYACRAGTTGSFCYGDDVERAHEYAVWGRPYGPAERIATLKPNAWGLYDMHGNVAEWVLDWYESGVLDAYFQRCLREGVVQDPGGPPTGLSHVRRGGTYYSVSARHVCSMTRSPMPYLQRPPLIYLFDKGIVTENQATGFRVVREAEM